MGQLRIEERRKTGVTPDKIKDELFGREVTQRLLGGDEAGTGRAVHERAGIEALPWPEHGFELVAVALLDRPFNNDVKILRGRRAPTITSPGRK